MKRSKSLVLFISMIFVFALTGCGNEVGTHLSINDVAGTYLCSGNITDVDDSGGDITDREFMFIIIENELYYGNEEDHYKLSYDELTGKAHLSYTIPGTENDMTGDFEFKKDGDKITVDFVINFKYMDRTRVTTCTGVKSK